LPTGISPNLIDRNLNPILEVFLRDHLKEGITKDNNRNSKLTF
jgi:hypothetical protein